MIDSSVSQATVGCSADMESRLDAMKASIPLYYITAIREFLNVRSFCGLRVLEIGGSSLPTEVVFDILGAAQWVCVDILTHDSGQYQKKAKSEHYESVGIRHFTVSPLTAEEPYLIYDGSAEYLPDDFDGQFDVIFSVNAFEHIGALRQVLARCHSALKEGGVLFSQFGPIWSGIAGSHFWVRPDLNFNQAGPIYPWAHLLEEPGDIRRLIADAGFPEATVSTVVKQIFESDFINRLHFEDYVELMEKSDFEDVKVIPLSRRNVPADTQATLQAKYPSYREFAAYGAQIWGSKLATNKVLDDFPVKRSFLIAGAGRSGTSCLAGMLSGSGYYQGDKLFPGNESNPRGFFENRLINDLNEAIIGASLSSHLGPVWAKRVINEFSAGQFWLGQWPNKMPVVCEPRQADAIRAMGLRAPFALKDPRFAFTAPAWLDALPNLTVLAIFRRPEVTAESILLECRTAAYLRSFQISVNDAFLVWRSTYERLLDLYKSTGKVLFVRYEDLFNQSRLALLESIISVKLNAGFADPRLNRTSGRISADVESTRLYGLLDSISKHDFGVDRASHESRIKEFKLAASQDDQRTFGP